MKTREEEITYKLMHTDLEKYVKDHKQGWNSRTTILKGIRVKSPIFTLSAQPTCLVFHCESLPTPPLLGFKGPDQERSRELSPEPEGETCPAARLSPWTHRRDQYRLPFKQVFTPLHTQLCLFVFKSTLKILMTVSWFLVVGRWRCNRAKMQGILWYGWL